MTYLDDKLDRIFVEFADDIKWSVVLGTLEEKNLHWFW